MRTRLAQFLGSCPPDPESITWVPCQQCKAPMQSDGLACTGAAKHLPPHSQLTLYATLTGTRRNMDAIHLQGARVLVGPDQLSRFSGRIPPLAWAIDNGAWGCYQRGMPFDAAAFGLVLERWGHGADWIVAPDIVAGGLESLALSLSWLPRLARLATTLIAVQDGMRPEDLRPHIGGRVGIFVGGSTAWKWRTLPGWAALARSRGAHLHVGRVNSAKAIRACASLGVNSCDGTSMSRYAVNAPLLGSAARDPVQTSIAVSSTIISF